MSRGLIQHEYDFLTNFIFHKDEVDIIYCEKRKPTLLACKEIDSLFNGDIIVRHYVMLSKNVLDDFLPVQATQLRPSKEN